MKFLTFKTGNGILLAIAATALSACDRLPWDASPDKQIEVEAGTTPAATAADQGLVNSPKIEWTWTEAAGTRWTFGSAQPVTYWPDGGGIGIRTPQDATDLDVFLRSPKMEIAGSAYTKVVVDLECISPGEQDDLTIYYITDTHSESPNFRVTPLDSASLKAGERRKLVYDLNRLARGDRDWIESTIQRIRFDLPQGAGAEYVLHSVQICAPEDSACF